VDGRNGIHPAQNFSKMYTAAAAAVVVGGAGLYKGAKAAGNGISRKLSQKSRTKEHDKKMKDLKKNMAAKKKEREERIAALNGKVGGRITTSGIETDEPKPSMFSFIGKPKKTEEFKENVGSSETKSATSVEPKPRKSLTAGLFGKSNT
jgi:hypothetical protein